jgi:hypothetical protein
LAHAQGSFQNLDFENANPVVPNPLYPDEVTPASALPGWSGSINSLAVTQVLLNDYTLGDASIDIFGPGWNFPNPGIIAGNYTVMLQAGANPQGGGAGVNASISQNGTIPAGAISLEFKAWSMIPDASFSVSFAGNSLSPVGLSFGTSPSGQGYEVYGADISSYAGQSGELEFTDVFDDQGLNGIELDDISFSTAAVTPEPNTLALAVLGGLALAARRWRKMRL